MVRRSVIALVLTVSVWLTDAMAQTAAPAVKNNEDYDEIVANALVEFKIPGVSVAVVKEGKVIYAKGFGYRDV